MNPDFSHTDNDDPDGWPDFQDWPTWPRPGSGFVSPQAEIGDEDVVGITLPLDQVFPDSWAEEPFDPNEED